LKCGVCGREIHESYYRCGECGKVYCLSCAERNPTIKSLGVCPDCEETYEAEIIVKQVLAKMIYEEKLEGAPLSTVLKVCKKAAKDEWGQELSPQKFGRVLRDLGFREKKTIKRIGRRGARLLVFSSFIKHKIPPPEGEPEKQEQLNPFKSG